ncbi:hypothetical protein KEM52_000285 [Ascosphaera acerosa]|nr:hypothetical protein KEM52_000285 [Ascosphaera acerosa]
MHPSPSRPDTFFPVRLASSMLPASSESTEQSEPWQDKEDEGRGGQKRRAAAADWDIAQSMNNGLVFPCLAATGTLIGTASARCVQCSPSELLSPGRIIGISWLAPSDPGVGHEDLRMLASAFVEHLLAKHLAQACGLLSMGPISDATPTLAHVVQYYDSRPFDPSSLYETVRSYMADHRSELGPVRTEEVLRTCHHRLAMTFPDIVRAVDEVAAQCAEQVGQQSSSGPGVILPRLLIIEGIDHALSEMQRSSSLLAAQAALAPFLRSLARLARSHPADLAIVVVNSDGVVRGPAPATIESIFASPDTGDGVPAATAIFSSPVAWSLDQTIDTHLLVSNVGVRGVVEVAKDRAGGSLGKWCLL